jgi:hypothetical protein
VSRLEWHQGDHPWAEHSGWPRHQHSLNGALTIAPGDTRVHFAGGLPFASVADWTPGDSVRETPRAADHPLQAAREPEPSARLAARTPAAVHWTVRDCADSHGDPRMLVPHDHYVAAEPYPPMTGELRQVIERQMQAVYGPHTQHNHDFSKDEPVTGCPGCRADQPAEYARREGEQRIRAAGQEAENSEMWQVAVQVVPGYIERVLEAIERLPDAAVYRAWPVRKGASG